MCLELQEFCRDNGSGPYSPQMNGRMNRTLTDKAWTILIDSNLQQGMWGEAIYFSGYTGNRNPTSSKGKTPIELWEGRKPTINNLKAFGRIAHRHVPAEVRKILNPKREKLIMVGYALNGMQKEEKLYLRKALFLMRAKRRKQFEYFQEDKN